jgi:hypothetical protein
MAETTKYARTTISVPPDLKERMDSVQESVNWSALACRAFEDKLAEIAVHKEKKDMSDIVTRLRASKRQAEDTQYKAGAEAGREWAGDTAEADDLQRLERWKERCGWEWEQCFDNNPTRSCTVAELVAENVWPDEDRNVPPANEFWERALGEDTSETDNPSFVKGFVEGALALWDEVKAQL